MKNRRLLIAVFLCFAMLVTGVGYATLSGHLAFDGTASYNQGAAQAGFLENIYFSQGTVAKSGSAEAPGSVEDEAVATTENAIPTAKFMVRTLAVQGEVAQFTYKLTNDNTVAANITVSATHDNGDPNGDGSFTHYQIDYIQIDNVKFVENDAIMTANNYTLGAGQSVTVTVQVSLLDTPDTSIAQEGFYLHVTATSVDAP